MSDSRRTKVIKIDFESDDNTIFPTVTNMLINFDEDQFYIRFYQARPPAVLDGDLPDMVKATLVACMAVPEAKLKDMVRAMQENLARRNEHRQDDLDIDLDSLKELEADDE